MDPMLGPGLALNEAKDSTRVLVISASDFACFGNLQIEWGCPPPDFSAADL